MHLNLTRFIAIVGIMTLLLALVHEESKNLSVWRAHHDNRKTTCSKCVINEHTVSFLPMPMLMIPGLKSNPHLTITKDKQKNNKVSYDSSTACKSESYISSKEASLSTSSGKLKHIHSSHYSTNYKEEKTLSFKFNYYNYNVNKNGDFIENKRHQLLLGWIAITFFAIRLWSQKGSLKPLLLLGCLSGFIPTVMSACPAGTYIGPTDCLPCAIGHFSSTPDASACTACDPGTFAPGTGNNKCYDCDKGTYQGATGVGTCNPCGAGYTTYGYACREYASCQRCDRGQSSYVMGTDCFDCPPGTYNNDLGSPLCIGCPAGTHSSSYRSTTCLECIAGYFSSGGAANCQPCPAGSYGNTIRASSCTQCDPGYTASSGSTYCTYCGVGTFSSSDRSSCIQAYPGYYVNFPPVSAQIPCSIGYAQDGYGKTSCYQCTNGTVAPTQASTACTPCSAGTYFISTTQYCSQCAAGYFQNLTAQSSCNECPIGTYSNSGAPSCTNCSAGHYSTAVKSPSCLSCVAGTYQNQSGSDNCLDCPVGTYSNVGSPSCTNCSTGYYSNNTKTPSCSACSPGSFQNLTGSIGCNDCPAGSSSAAGSTSCTNCTPGTYAPTNKSTSCFSCPSGSYQTLSSATSCDDCPAGKSSAAGATFCTICSPGTYAPTARSSSCFSCPTGSFQTQNGATSCDDCPPGKSSASGAITCTSCSPGTYAPTARSSSCFNCPTGSFQTLSGASSCDDCPPGKSSGAAATSCTSCTPGTYAPTARSSSCFNCPAGTFINQVGASNCTNCSAGFYSPSGQTSCTPCSKGYSQGLPGQGSCPPCEKGFYQDSTQQTSCIQCATNTIAASTATITCSPCSTGTGFVSSLAFDRCLYKGLFVTQADFLASSFYSTCFSSSVIVKPFMYFCRRAYMINCCDVGTPFANVSCNLALELQSGDFDFSNYCTLCSFYNKNACPTGGLCWNDVTDVQHTNFTLACLETVAPYCSSRLYANLLDPECFVFTNSCVPILDNSSYGSRWDVFTIYFTRRLASAIPTCKDIFDLPKMLSVAFDDLTCVRTSDYTIGVNVSALNGPFMSFYLTNNIKGACGLNITNSTVQNIIRPDDLGVVQITGSTNDKCANLVINSTLTKSYRWPIVGQFWTIQYTNITGIPSETIQRLSTIGNYKTTFTIMDYDLFSGKVLTIYSTIITPYQLNITSNTLTITIPNIASGKMYCGACQLNNRGSCTNYDGVCWESYMNFKISDPFNTTTCLKAISNECYKTFLSTSIDNPQCLDFKSYYNFTAMKIKPSLLSARYSSSGSVIILTFSDNIYIDDFTDCSGLFTLSTLKWLPSSKSGRWISKTVLQVDYDPQVGIVENLTLVGNALHFDYIYAQEYVNSVTIPIALPLLDCEIRINGVKNVSDCGTMELFAAQVTSSLLPLVFKWDIDYNYASLDSSTQDKLRELLSNYAIFSTQSTFTLPSQYLVRGTIVKVTLYAKYQGRESNIINTYSEVKVNGGAVGIKFVSKSQIIFDLDGSLNNRIAFEISNKKCSKNGTDADAGTIPVDIQFQVSSSYFNLNTETLLRDEKDVAAQVNNVYRNIKALVVGNSLGFEYMKYYSVTAVIIDLLTQDSYTDNMGIRITKPGITAVIDPIGTLVSISNDVQLNGANSIIPIPSGDTIEYKWKCMSASSFSLGGSCLCPYLDDSNMIKSSLILPKNLLKSFCKYTFSLTVIASYNDFKRTSRSEIQFLSFPGAAIPLKGRTLAGSNENITDIYFTFGMPGDTVKDSEIPLQWSLLEVISENTSSSVQFSMKNTFIYDFFANFFNQTLDPRVKFGDTQIPSNYIPSYLTSTSVRVLGIDKDSLQPQYRYSFGVTVSYPFSPTFLFVDYLTPPSPRKRELTISPMSGIGFDTQFKISFTLSSSTSKDEAQYQIFKRSCPSNNSEMITLTQQFSLSNSYTTVISQGLKSCNYQVEIIVRAYEYGGKIDSSVMITVEEQTMSASEAINAQINKLNGTELLPMDQKIALLSQISSTVVSEASAQGAANAKFIIDQLSTIDNISGSEMNLMSSDEKKSMLSTGASIIASLAINQKLNIDITLASTMKTKVDNYLVGVQTMESGSFIIPSIVAALSGIADIGLNKQNDISFFASMQKSMSKVKDILLNEMPPGGPPNVIESPAINIFVIKKYASDFENNQSLLTPKGVSVSLPGDLQSLLIADLNDKLNGPVNVTRLLSSGSGSSKGIGNSTLTIGSSICDTTFNPFSTIKTNARIDNKTLGNSSSSIVNSETVTNIYTDLNKGYLNDVVNTKEQDNSLVQLGLSPFDFNKSAIEKAYKMSLSLGQLPHDAMAQFSIPSAQDIGDYINNTIMTPLYYLPDKKIWTNENCSLLDTKANKKKFSVNCTSVGKKTIESIDSAISITVDVVKDIFNVISSGNYKQLANVQFLASAGSRTAIAYSVLFGTIALIILVELYLKKKDELDLHSMKRKVLLEHFIREETFAPIGVLSKIFSFLVETRRTGIKKTSKRNQGSVVPTVHSKLDKRKKEKPIGFNGATRLSPEDEEILKDLYDLFQQCAMVYTDEEVEEVLRDEIKDNIVLHRLTKITIDDEVIRKPITFLSLLKLEHPIVSAFSRPEITTPRTIKFLILMCAFIGEFFITGYFYGSSSDDNYSESIVGKAALYSIAAALLMIPLTIIIAIFLRGPLYQEDMTRKQIESADANINTFRTIGFVLASAWIGGCLYGIIMYIVSFSDSSLIGWVGTYFCSFFFDNFIVYQLKILFKVIFGFLILKVSRTKLLLTAAGVIASKIVDKIISLL